MRTSQCDELRSARRSFQVEVSFRFCREEDLPALEWMGLYTTHREIIRRTFDQQVRDRALMLLGLANEFPVAQAWVDYSRPNAVRCPRFWAVRVFPALQGTGIGTKLMKVAEQVVRMRGATYAELGVEHENEAACRFYRRLGYRPVGRGREQINYRFEDTPLQMTIDQQIMRKPLTLDARLEGIGCVADAPVVLRWE